MKKLLPVLLGFLLPLTLFLYFLAREEAFFSSNRKESDNLGIVVGYGDPNIAEISFPDLFVEDVTSLISDKAGSFSIIVKNLTTGETISLNEDVNYYAASLYKLPVAISVLQAIESEELRLDENLTYLAKHYHTGSGTLQKDPIGTVYTVEVLLQRLIKDSDNVAQSILLDKVGFAEVRAIMPTPRGLKSSQFSLILEHLYFSDYLNEENTYRLLSYMGETSFDNRVNVGLVKGISFSHKIGNWARSGSWHDCGIATNMTSPTIICVMSQNTTYKDFMSVTAGIGNLVSIGY